MNRNLWRICLLLPFLVSVQSSNETNSTTVGPIDPRIQLIPEGNDYESEGMCPIDVSVYMTGCWIDSFNVWQLNISEITTNGVVRGWCQSSPECDFRFCCAAFQAMKCFATIGQHICAPQFSRMAVKFGQTLNRVCDSVFEDKCRSVVSISESLLKTGAKHISTETNSSVLIANEKEPLVQVLREPEIQKITIQLRFIGNGSVGAIASFTIVSVLLLIGGLFV